MTVAGTVIGYQELTLKSARETAAPLAATRAELCIDHEVTSSVLATQARRSVLANAKRRTRIKMGNYCVFVRARSRLQTRPS
jgi:hypothetical protein